MCTKKEEMRALVSSSEDISDARKHTHLPADQGKGSHNRSHTDTAKNKVHKNTSTAFQRGTSSLSHSHSLFPFSGLSCSHSGQASHLGIGMANSSTSIHNNSSSYGHPSNNTTSPIAGPCRYLTDCHQPKLF